MGGPQPDRACCAASDATADCVAAVAVVQFQLGDEEEVAARIVDVALGKMARQPPEHWPRTVVGVMREGVSELDRMEAHERGHIHKHSLASRAQVMAAGMVGGQPPPCAQTVLTGGARSGAERSGQSGDGPLQPDRGEGEGEAAVRGHPPIVGARLNECGRHALAALDFKRTSASNGGSVPGGRQRLARPSSHCAAAFPSPSRPLAFIQRHSSQAISLSGACGAAGHLGPATTTLGLREARKQARGAAG